ncbi:hypothetical protein [Pseudoalteromonas sp. G4]|uniref:hypothetical protein n=1 Tax=Pseudoalteromonas sp. G4 TaxID=2992761 RepID=UPI00237ECB0B|nr:hypothetical protein [Pseudoalteromonas sp. G4]MDE3273977.1 hypothetical protein [Pseudoalteromonas sp. G4]
MAPITKRYTDFYGADGHFKSISDNALLSFVRDDEFTNFSQDVLVRALQNPEQYVEPSIDDFIMTLELSKRTWKRMRRNIGLLKSKVGVKVSSHSGGELGHLYKRQVVFKFLDGGEIRFHFDPVLESDGCSEVRRSSRVSTRISQLGFRNFSIFLGWLKEQSNGEYDKAVRFDNSRGAKGTTRGAYATRLDFEFKIHGLPIPFLLTRDPHHMSSSYAIWPEDASNSMVESFSHGNHSESSHCLSYDPVLKLVGDGTITLPYAKQLLPMSKIERRQLSSKDGNGGLLVSALIPNSSPKLGSKGKGVQTHLGRLEFFSPKLYHSLPDELAVKVARFKLDAVWKRLGTRETRQLKKALSLDCHKIFVDSDAIERCFFKKLDKLYWTIVDPITW